MQDRTLPPKLEDFTVAHVHELARRYNAMLPVLRAARCIRHWHDRGEGMVVSAEHVRLLWAAISEHDNAMEVPFHER